MPALSGVEVERFIWITPDAQLNEEPRVKTAQFGDGYGQDSPDGLNALLQRWELVFEDIYKQDALAIRAFLVARNAVERFEFKSPLGEIITVKCRKWQVKPAKKDRLTVTCTFEQVP